MDKINKEMSLFDAIKLRYSHKDAFLPTPVPKEDLEKIAHAGLSAPTGMNTQSISLVLLPDRSALDPLCEIAPTIGLKTAPAAIALFADTTVPRYQGISFELEDYSAACQNICLAATALGYSTLWLDSPFFVEENQKAAVKLLNAPAGFNLKVVVPVGIPDGLGSRREKQPLSSRMHYIKFP